MHRSPDIRKKKEFNLRLWLTDFPQQFLASFRYIPRSLHLAWQVSVPMSMGITALTLISAALPLGVAYAGKHIIDAVVARLVSEAAWWVGAELLLIIVQSLVLRALFLLRSLLGAKLGLRVNVMILEKAQTLELRHFEDPEFYDQLTRARREASTTPVTMVTETLQLMQNLLTLCGYIGILVSYSGWMVCGLLLAALPATVSEMRFSNTAFRMRNWRSPDARKLNYVEYVLANDDHVKEVKIFGLSRMLLERYRSLGERFYGEDRDLAVRRSAWAYGLSLLATGAFYGCYLYMGLAAARGILTLGNLTLYVVAFRQGQQSFQSCLTAVGSMYEGNLYMSNLFSFLSISTVTHTKAEPTPDILPPLERSQGIVFENVGFRYPGREAWALREVSLKIPAGESLALVGQNGAGKSTFIKLLCRLYDPSEGRILLDGVDLRAWDPEILRGRMAVVFQDFNQYHFTFSENVAVGSVAHLEDQSRIGRAVNRGGAEEVLQGLAQGLQTPLGRWFNDGVELSGGQWQKVALARAFMREEADILVLDEPTAALDAEAEHRVFERFRTLTQGKTCILISHRFPTVRMADHIVVIEEGRILEQGSHDALVKAGGRYAALFALQAKGYR